jgi:hypothetical protein
MNLKIAYAFNGKIISECGLMHDIILTTCLYIRRYQILLANPTIFLPKGYILFL